MNKVNFCFIKKNIAALFAAFLIVIFYAPQFAYSLTVDAALLSANIPIPIKRPLYQRKILTAKSRNVQTLQGIKVSLADAVFLGVRNNRSIKSAYLRRVAQKFALREAEEQFQPKFNIAGSLKHDRIKGVGSNTFDISPGIKLATKSGTKFEFAWKNNISGTSGVYQRDTGIGFNVIHPLLKGGGRAVNLAPLQVARLGELINRLQLRATISEAVGSIILAHRTLLTAQEEIKLAQINLARNEELIQFNLALIKAGRLAEKEYLQFEADRENQKIAVLVARQALENARLNLLDKMGIDLGTKIVAQEKLHLQRIAADFESVMEIALSQRPDFLSQLHVIAQKNIGVVVADNATLWTVDLFASANYGVKYQPQQERLTSNDISIGLRFELPLNDRTPARNFEVANNQVIDSELQLKTIRNTIELRIRRLLSNIDLLWQRVALSRKAISNARQLVEIEKLKLKAGRSSAFQLRGLVKGLKDAEQQHLSTKIAYLNALTQLDLETGTTLQTWKIELLS